MYLIDFDLQQTPAVIRAVPDWFIKAMNKSPAFWTELWSILLMPSAGEKFDNSNRLEEGLDRFAYREARDSKGVRPGADKNMLSVLNSWTGKSTQLQPAKNYKDDHTHSYKVTSIFFSFVAYEISVAWICAEKRLSSVNFLRFKWLRWIFCGTIQWHLYFANLA